MLASFQVPEEGIAHDAVATRGGGDPDELAGRPTPLYVEVREVTPTRIDGGQIRHSDRLWVRVVGELPDDPLVQACAIAYLSDLGSGFGQVEVEGLPRRRTEHRPQPLVPRADPRRRVDAARAVAAQGGQRAACTTAPSRSRTGALGAVFAQEMLLRHHFLPPELLERMAEYLGVTPDE